MQQANEMRDRLIREFTESYMEKLFYFCLKKTGKSVEAEDLTQDVALQIISALNKGTIPTSFSAWVWQIARNRYAAWANKKHSQSESVTGSDVGDYEIEDERDNILGEMIRAEQMALLRRELAFIKSDYRNIVVAYYIEDKSVREIADTLALSTNTVKSRLLRARQILKEGMDMAREFGKRSYRPEDITFVSSGSQPSGLPFSAVQRKIPQNILLQASNNPSTVEELSIELGIALPYMEEEVAILHEATLLEKWGDKYITNFFILDKECRVGVYHTLRKNARERSKLMREIIDDKILDIRSLNIAGTHLDDNTVRWWLVPTIVDHLVVNTTNVEPHKRANGESWGFVGYEITELPEKIFMGQNGYGNNEKNTFWFYKCSDYSLWNQCGDPSCEEAELICNCVRENRNISTFNDMEKIIWDGIDGKYAHTSETGDIIPDVLVITTEKCKRIHQLFHEHKNYDKLVQNVTEAYKAIETIFKKYSHPVLHSNIGYYIGAELFNMRMIAIHDLVEDEFLKLPEDFNKSSLGMYLMLK